MAAFSEEYSSASLKGKNAFVRESKAVASSTIWGLSMKYHPSIQAQKNNTTCYIRECLTAAQKTPSELKNKPPVDDLGFGKHFTDHMLRIKWTQAKGWEAPVICKLQNMEMHPAAKVNKQLTGINIQLTENNKYFRIK